jgi:hypothetical protein
MADTLKEQAVQAAADALVEAVKESHYTNAGVDSARVAIEAAWGTLTQPLADWQTTARAAHDTMLQFEVEINRLRAHLAVLEQAAKDLVTTLNKPIFGRRVGEYATNLERLQAVIDGTHEATL